MKLALAVLAAVLLVGCGGHRLTDAQARELAQARADTEAARLVATDNAARSALYQAAGARLMAGLADLDLPAPTVPVAALVTPAGEPILAAVEEERSAATESEGDPPSGWLAAAAGVAGGVGLMALSVLRFSPGAFGLLANLAHTVLAPKATRDMRAAQAKAMDVAHEAVAYGHTLAQAATAAGHGPLVLAAQAEAARIQDRLGIRPQVQTILAAVKARAASPSPPPAQDAPA